MKKVIFPGSFDPFHEGHFFIVQQSLKKFDFIYIIVSWNKDKKRRNSFEASVEIIKDKLKEIDKNKFKILINKNQLTPEIAVELNCFNIVRGIRNEKDLEYEKLLKKEYLKIEPKIKMFYFNSSNSLKEISSSYIVEKQSK